MDRAVSFNNGVLVEVLGDREAQENGKPEYELSSETVEVAELKET